MCLASRSHDSKFKPPILLPDPRKRELVTPAVLVKIASSQKAFHASNVTNLREDPSYLCEQILLHAFRATELLPDAKGNRPNVEAMLANPRYLGQQIRFAVHNNLQQLGYWAIIEKFLEDVVELDNDTGRSSTAKRSERLEIMNGVAGMVEQAIEIISTRVRLGILTDPQFRGFWLRKKVRPSR